MTQVQSGGSPSSVERVDVIGRSFPLSGSVGDNHYLCIKYRSPNARREPLVNCSFAKAQVVPAGNPIFTDSRHGVPTFEPPHRVYSLAMALPPPSESTAALITGASSGIGEHLARELAARGHGLILVARREERLRALADALAHTHRVRAEVIAADLSVADTREALPMRVAERGLTIDILVNNAGFTTVGPVSRADRQAELAMERTNVEAVVDLCTTFVTGMVGRRRGAILNTASTAAFQPWPGTSSLRRLQVVRRPLAPRPGGRAQGHRGHRHDPLPGARGDRVRPIGRPFRRRGCHIAAQDHVGSGGKGRTGGGRWPGGRAGRRHPRSRQPGRRAGRLSGAAVLDASPDGPTPPRPPGPTPMTGPGAFRRRRRLANLVGSRLSASRWDDGATRP